jgi:hypothetical protein
VFSHMLLKAQQPPQIVLSKLWSCRVLCCALHSSHLHTSDSVQLDCIRICSIKHVWYLSHDGGCSIFTMSCCYVARHPCNASSKRVWDLF